jgi:two-component system, NarL family, nitrate/nitrite response regulator NarL
MTTASVCILDEQVFRRDSLARALAASGITIKAHYAEASRFVTSLGALAPQAGIIIAHTPSNDVPGAIEDAAMKCPQVPLLVLGSAKDSEMLDHCTRLGVAAYLDPEVTDVSGLIRSIGSVLDGHHLYPSSVLDGLIGAAGGKSDSTTRLAPLSARERQVLTYLAAGADNLKIASLLDIAERTVKAHVSSLYRKLGQENRTQLALLARQLGIRPPRQV